MVFRNAKTGEVVVGAEDKVEQCTYVAAITRIPEELDDEVTGGWKVVEVGVHVLDFDKRLIFLFRWQEEVLEHICRRHLHTYYTYSTNFLDHFALLSNCRRYS